MNGNGNMMNTDKKTLMQKLTEVDFAIHEAVLYLDGHPNNQKALEFYRRAVAERAELYAQYTSQYGPVTANGVKQDTWSWIDGPWPWQNGRE